MSQPKLVQQAARLRAAGKEPKLIDEYIGHVSSGTSEVSVAHMHSPGGWEEPGQTPEFDEFTVVLNGTLRVEYSDGVMEVRGGQPLSLGKASGFVTAHLNRKGPSISRSVYRRSRWTLFIATAEEHTGYFRRP